MLDRDPTSYDLITYGWVVALSLWSGLVSYHNKVKQGIVKVVTITELLGDLAASTLVGVLTFYMCELAEIEKLQAAVLISIAAHTGSRALFLYEKYWELKASLLSKKFINLENEQEKEDNTKNKL